VRRPALSAIALGAALSLVGCASASSSPSTTPSDAAVESAAGYADCAGGQLIGPDGTAVNLTGAWRGQAGIWLIRQSGTCVAAEFLSEFPGEEYGNQFRGVMSGDLHQDFTITGRVTGIFGRVWPWWMQGGLVQELTLGVRFADDATPFLHLAAPDGGAESIERFSTDTQVPPAP
jgi:uncharacterized membrane protein